MKLAVAFILLVASASLSAAQQQPPTFEGVLKTMIGNLAGDKADLLVQLYSAQAKIADQDKKLTACEKK